MKKILFIIPLLFITLSSSYLDIYINNIKNINKTTITSPKKNTSIKWWES